MIESISRQGGDGIGIIVDPGFQQLHRPVGPIAGIDAAAGSIVGRVIRIYAPSICVVGP
jgi:hypothetical protein